MAAFFRITIFFLSLFAVQSIHSQQVSFEYLTAKNGLPQSTVRGIVKDKFGFMWFGTWNGLCRYDGYSFKIYRTVFGDSTSLASNRIHYLYKDPDGTIWASVFNKTICRYNYETDDFTRFKLTDLPLPLQDSVNRLRSLDVFTRNAHFLQQLIGPFQLSQTLEHVVFQTRSGGEGGLNDNNVNCMLLDDAGILWLGTGAGGINMTDLNANKFHHVAARSKAPSKQHEAVRSMWVRDGRVWCGTEDDGVLIVEPASQNQFKLSEQWRGENIKMIFGDDRGDIWIGKRSGLDRYNPRTGQIVHLFDRVKQPAYSRFYTAATDPVTKQIWFAYYNGLLRYDPVLQQFEKQDIPAYGTSGAGSIFFDSRNDLWIGTEYSGLIHLKRNPKNNQWVDTVFYTGLGSNPLSPDERIYSIAEDVYGDIWVGAANALCCVHHKTGKIKTYTIKDGLADQYITKVMADQKGFVWFAHKNGLSKLQIKTGQVQNYSVKKPGQEYEFMDGSGFQNKADGQMYFGTTSGYIHFNPDEITDNPFLPKVTFTALQILNKPVNVKDSVNGRSVLSAPIHMTRSITLTHEDQSFSVEFSALHYSNPAKNQYAYMLEGQDNDWVFTSASRRLASYSNLAAGKYLLKVKASNSDGVWNPQPATLEIIVLPPWWETWWAYGIYFLIGALVLLAIYRIVQVRQQYHRQILTERLKAEKARELDQVKSSFFTNVSHEFRTPLTLIVDPLRSLLSREDATPGELAHYNVMYRNAQRLLTLINQFLDFRKIEAGSMQLNARYQDWVVFIKNIAAGFDFKAEDQEIEFEVASKPDKIMMGFDTDVAGKILYNLISNAFKFTPRGGHIKVSIAAANEKPESVEIRVSDDGIGIAPDKVEKIFDPFFQADAGHQQTGTGVGLSLTKELVELHKGKIKVESEPGKGTTFILQLAHISVVGENLNPTHQGYEVEKPTLQSPVLTQVADAEMPIVLLVEDNEDIRNYIKQNLAATYKIVEGKNGEEGLQKAHEEIPDLVISDIMMPGMNGLELCARLKTDEKTSHIPVILLTARQSDQYETEGYETGADAYIVKPFSMPLLQTRVRNLIDNRLKLRTLFGQSPESFANPVGLNAADKAFLSKATGLIEAHMSEAEVNVEWLAAQLFMSRTQLYRKVKGIANQSVHEFVTGIRLNKAAELLLQGEQSISEIAFSVGYADATSFSRMFQKHYGTTPKKYSMQQKG
ncbi:hybrid sensor histidine kinase/response regulator transcription factor [Niabella insulamsoli]|uniref:hybrid sensor histidine kinase/response regulator transcription factor n=1 Tax=Niabella insulamsoli TaxID=3144874 RepID=UPI0031FD47C8